MVGLESLPHRVIRFHYHARRNTKRRRIAERVYETITGEGYEHDDNNDMGLIPEPIKHASKCRKCGWEGETVTRYRCLPCHAERQRQYRKDHPEQTKRIRKAYRHRFRRERPEQYNAARRRRYKPQRAAAYKKKRMAWMLEGDVTREQLINLFAASKGKCHYCGSEEVYPSFHPITLKGYDHVIPRAKGGRHTISNLVVSCGPCNKLKRDLSAEEFRKRYG